MAESIIQKSLARDVDTLKNRMPMTGYVISIFPTGQSQTAKIKFLEGAVAQNFAMIFGRYGYNSQTMSLSIIANPSNNLAYVKNFGEQEIAVSAENNVVTITFPQTIARATVVSSVPIEVSY